MKSFFLSVLDLAKIFAVALLIFGSVRYFLFKPFLVKGASMEPNYDDGQYLVIDEISYRFSSPQRGDVVVFKYPLDPSQYYIKRIIGLPGETVEVTDGKVIVYNQQHPEGQALNEGDYLNKSVFTPFEGRHKLLTDEYFVIGDNRAASYDSRKWGPVKKNLIVGKVWLRAWPFDAVQVMEAPSY